MSKLLLLAAVLLAAPQQDRTRVRAQLSEESVRAGETVVLGILVETPSTADIHIRLPTLPNLITVIGSQESSQVQYAIPGGRRRVLTRELVLQPAAPGTFSIPAIEIDVGGTVYRTQPLTLIVSGTGAPNPSMNRSEAWLRATMSPETVYVGQQSTLTIQAGFSEEVRLRLARPPIFDTPAPTGFWVQELPGGVRSQLRAVDGQVVEVHTKKIAHFPLTPGRFALRPSRAILDIRQGFLYAPETREIRSASPRVTVLPLPENGKPTAFRGAVGRYSLQASVEPLSVGAGEPVQIKLMVSGTGNVKALAAPPLPQLLGAEVFAPTEEAVTRFEGEAVAGTKTFTYVVIPENEGLLKIPAITFAYFDPAVRAYRTAVADPVEVRVTASTGDRDAGVSSGSLQSLRRGSQSVGLRWVRSPLFALLQALPLLFIAGLLLWRRRSPRVNRATEFRARVRAATVLPDAEVYRELDHIVREALDHAPRASEVARRRASRLIERIERARFAPTPPPRSTREAIENEAETVVMRLFGQRSARAAVFGFALLLTTQQPFTTGVQSYEAGDYQAAVAAFEQQTKAAPRDVSAWYNLGNSYYRTGDRGAAIWAWATALRLDPRSSDVVHNLRAAGNVEAIRVRPPLAVRAEEWLLLASLLWLITTTLAIVALVQKRRISPWLAAPLVVSLVCALVGWRAGQPIRYAIALSEPTALYSEPTIRSPLFRNMRVGAVLTIEEERADWLRVRTIDKRDAWVPRDDVKEVANDHAP
ncbi:MAG TPA: BatD family protein [Longimicrobiales bacterium]